MDKKKKRQLLQNREDFIAQLYQGIHGFVFPFFNDKIYSRMFIDKRNK